MAGAQQFALKSKANPIGVAEEETPMPTSGPFPAG